MRWWGWARGWPRPGLCASMPATSFRFQADPVDEAPKPLGTISIGRITATLADYDPSIWPDLSGVCCLFVFILGVCHRRSGGGTRAGGGIQQCMLRLAAPARRRDAAPKRWALYVDIV